MPAGLQPLNTDPRHAGAPLRDLWARVLLSPVFGVIIPTFGGLVDHRRHNATGLILRYAAFSVIAFIIWEGNRRLYFRRTRPVVFGEGNELGYRGGPIRSPHPAEARR